jgi:trehalose 6-phosphate phosphatase
MQTDTRLAPQANINEIVGAIEKIVHGKELLIAFDRDGTLVPYADRPEDALLDPVVHEHLRALAVTQDITAGIISARSTAQLRGEFDADLLFLAGNYGLEIHLPEMDPIINAQALQSARALKAARDELAPLVRKEVNAILEDHGFTLCLHWHTVPTASRDLVHMRIAEVSKKFPQLLFRAQPTSYEVLPDSDWNKGEALACIDAAVPRRLERTFVFIGDTAADEPAFAWVNAQGGISIKVGSAGENTCSNYQIPDTTQTQELLSQLVMALGSRLSELD